MTKRAIDSARREIVIIAGELGSWLFPELKEATKQASKRGVDVRVYATHATPRSTYLEIRNMGAEIYLGRKPVKDHYLVIDSKTYIVSRKKGVGIPSKTGERWGYLYENEPSGARKIKRSFSELAFLSFLKKDRDRSILSKVADIIFQCSIPRYQEIEASLSEC